jgi:GNAT superfamily N-acetyltransferase
VDVSLAGPDDVPQLARLLWLFAAPAEQERQSAEAFAADLRAWWAEHAGSHVAVVARDGGSDLVGMAWLALVARVPRPGTTARRSADVQSVFVLPERRGQGIGTALVRTARDRAVALGAAHVSVHASREAVPLYERLGFASSRLFLVSDRDQPG